MSEHPLPVPPLGEHPELAAHFDGLRERRLVLPRCARCDVVIWYPRPFCPVCGDTSITWFEASGNGEVYSYTIVEKGLDPFAEHVPYVVAYVELDEGPRVLTNVVRPWHRIAVGSRVAAVFQFGEDGTPILRFRLAPAAQA